MLLLPAPTASPFTVGVPLPIYSCADRWTQKYSANGDLQTESLKRTLIIPYNPITWTAFKPLLRTAFVTQPWLLLTGADCQQLASDPARATLVLTYEQTTVPFDPGTKGEDLSPGATPSSGSNTFQRLPDSYADENGATVSKSITEHPDFTSADAMFDGSAPSDYWDDEKGRFTSDAPAGLPQVSQYYEGTFTVTWHDFSYVKLQDPRRYVGKLAIPPGYDGEAKNWIVLSGYRSRQGGYWRRSLVYHYSPQPAECVTFFYDTAS